MNLLNIDITALDATQLEVLKGIAPEAVAAELQRRQSYETLAEGLSFVFQRNTDLKARFDALKNSPAAKEVKASGIIEAVERLMNYARTNSVEFTEPTPVTYEKPALKSTSEAGAEGEQAAAEGKKGKGKNKGAEGEQAQAGAEGEQAAVEA